MYRIYHNRRCGKSRQTLELLKTNVGENNIKIIDYLNEGLKEVEIKELSKMLNLPILDFIRTNEPEFKPYKKTTLTDEEYIRLLVKTPKLLERPIVIKGNQAIIGRPPENVQKLF